MKANKLNWLYAVWVENPCERTLGNLLEGVRIRVVQRFARLVPNDEGQLGPLDSNFEDIANDTVVQVWRSLPGYPGEDFLKLFKDDGRFASWVATIANNIRKNAGYAADSRLVSKYDPKDLEYIQAGLEPGYESPDPPDYWEEPYE